MNESRFLFLARIGIGIGIGIGTAKIMYDVYWDDECVVLKGTMGPNFATKRR